MPIALTTALDAGDVTTATLDHVKIVNCSYRLGARPGMMLTLEYGTIDGDGAWVPGDVSPSDTSSYPSHVHITDSDPDTDYTDMVSTHTPNEGELTYVAAKRCLYEYLQAKHSSLAGSIV